MRVQGKELVCGAVEGVGEAVDRVSANVLSARVSPGHVAWLPQEAVVRIDNEVPVIAEVQANEQHCGRLQM